MSTQTAPGIEHVRRSFYADETEVVLLVSNAPARPDAVPHVALGVDGRKPAS